MGAKNAFLATFWPNGPRPNSRKNVLAWAHKKFCRIQHPEIYLLDLKVQYEHKMKLPLDMIKKTCTFVPSPPWLQLGGIKLILLDKISMIGNNMFTVQINNRLKDIRCQYNCNWRFIPVTTCIWWLHFQWYSKLRLQHYGPQFMAKILSDVWTWWNMRQRESKQFTEILNRLREGKHTDSDIVKIKEQKLHWIQELMMA